jgi:acetoin utilization protein AcuB
MLVRDCMTPNPTTVRRDSDPMAAQTLMRYGKLRRLPVLDENDCLVGIVTTSDLHLFFSTAPSPGVAKRQYRVDQVMTSPVITVPPNYPLEEAAETMRVNKVTGLPVVQEGRLVGIITAGDILAQLVESMGGNISASLRVTIQFPNQPGQLARVATRIAGMNYNICSMLSATVGDQIKLTMRLQGPDHAAVLQAIRELEDVTVVNVWESAKAGE